MDGAMKTSSAACAVLVLTVLGATVAGCGSSPKKAASTTTTQATTTTAETTPAAGSKNLQPGDIAVVDGQHVTTSMLASGLVMARAQLKSQGVTAPKAGSAGYKTLVKQVVSQLISQAETDAQAAKLGVSVTDAQVQSQLEQIKQQNYGGSDAQYQAALKQLGVTDALVRQEIKEQLLQQALGQKVTKSVKVSDADVHTYYAQHSKQYMGAESRKVREILVGKGKQALAEQIYTQLKGGASFTTLAKRYSQDPGSKNSGGNFTATKGSDVPEFDQAVFAGSAKTGQLLKPVDTSAYGWFVIQPLAAIVPPKPIPEAQVASTIKAQLLQTRQQQVVSKWAKNVTKTYCSSGAIVERTGYRPSPDPCAAAKK
jgi:parvulin-like peptidyl-prolyl isomerase